MDIFVNRDVEKNHMYKISISDLEFFSKQLSELVRLYRKHIFIPDEATDKAVCELEYYANLLQNKQYAALISNADEIITYKPDETVPF